jgi:hypothetical protein
MMTTVVQFMVDSWHQDVMEALEASDGEPVPLMRKATMWAVAKPGALTLIHLVLAASQEAQTLKVCTVETQLRPELRRKIRSWQASRLVHETCLFLEAEVRADAERCSDPSAFTYLLTTPI